jgi:hypothetical protein
MSVLCGFQAHSQLRAQFLWFPLLPAILVKGYQSVSLLSFVTQCFTDPCRSFGTSRIYQHDRVVVPKQRVDADRNGFELITRDALGISCRELVNDASLSAMLVEPLLKGGAATRLLLRPKRVICELRIPVSLAAKKRHNVQDFSVRQTREPLVDDWHIDGLSGSAVARSSTTGPTTREQSPLPVVCFPWSPFS